MITYSSNRLEERLVKVTKISADFQEQINPAQVEQIAQDILTLEGSAIIPLVVERQGLEGYKLVRNYLGFKAAQRARELNPLKSEFVKCYVLEHEDHENAAILRQWDAAHAPATPAPINWEQLSHKELEAIAEQINSVVARRRINAMVGL
ncbi:MAG: hypothetical protein F6K24_16385 [Okeania sp. SIO2D1]|nr:hypothetical protein [Okeania sp. SIO2D1]